jgi:prolyl-tRNA synthetase
MRASRAFIPTLREAPREAEIASHILMLRAGLMKQLAAGLYSFLPLGWKAVRKVEQIVREEMDRAGGLEILMPALQPDSIWKQSGRWEVMGPEMMRLKDRNERQFVLGPTHEEIVTDIASKGIASYRDLPKNFYQIQTKFRDEVRPRFGVIRAREFIMKDAYSFDRDEEGLDKSYWEMYEAYDRIFKRCGIRAVPVEADTGVMGGNFSHEFMALVDTGESEIAFCEETGFYANREVCSCLSPEEPKPEIPDPAPPCEKVPTPGASTIEEVCRFLKVEPKQLIKTLIYVTDDEPVAVLIRGDREANEIKLANHLGKAVELAPPAVIEQVTGAPVGFAGPVGLESIRILADPEVLYVTDGVTGANEADAHFIHVIPGRDFPEPETVDLRMAVEGEPCPSGKPGTLSMCRGTEVGQVFKLGTKYTEALEALYTDEKSQLKPMVMGCYGIGVTRTLAAALDQNHDENGIIWPVSLAPYDVHVLPLVMKNEEIVEAGNKIAEQLQSAGLSVLLDDRGETPGIKFNDADLLGLPVRVIIGKKSLQEGKVELARRDRLEEKIKVDLGKVVEKIQEIRQELYEKVKVD